MPRFYALGEDDDDLIFIGEDRAFRIQLVTLDSNGEDAVSADISANAYSFTLKEDKDDAAIFTLTTSGGAITFGNGDTSAWSTILGEVELPGNNSVAIVAMADTDTDGLPPIKYHWDLKRTDEGSEAVVAHGTMVLKKGIGA